MKSDFGGLLDIFVDFSIYCSIPVSVVDRSSPLALLLVILLLAVICVNAVVQFYLSALLAKREHPENGGSKKPAELTSIQMPSALTEGFEAIIMFSLMLVSGHRLALLVIVVFTGMVIVSIGQRLMWAYKHLSKYH